MFSIFETVLKQIEAKVEEEKEKNNSTNIPVSRAEMPQSAAAVSSVSKDTALSNSIDPSCTKEFKQVSEQLQKIISQVTGH